MNQPAPRRILWVDDEVEMLGAHILYLQERNYEVVQATNGPDAILLAGQQRFDVALVDEMMPVMNGLEVLRRLKALRADLPVVMVTKNEAEELMEEAIGSQIDGYLTKPVNPSQILSLLKGILDQKRISQAKLSQRWPQDFAEISLLVDGADDAAAWLDLHTRLSAWEISLDQQRTPELAEMLAEMRLEADHRFGAWVEDHYTDWLADDPATRPALSMDVVDRWLLPQLKGNPVLFLVIDALRLDQWMGLEPLLADSFDIRRDVYFSILPTATPYARNALFSGLTPAEIERVHPDLWGKGDEDEASSNRYERQFLIALLERRGISLKPEPKYVKILQTEEAAEFERRVNEYTSQPLTAVVYNFIDILLHTRQSVEVLKEMIPDESAFRSVFAAWFEHSSLNRILRAYAEAGGTIVLTSDHGAMRGRRGAKVVGDRETSTNLRYKYGRNLQIEGRQAIRIRKPELWGLPQRSLNTEYIIAREDYFFVYPTNYHRYLEMYRDSFQHGGVSLCEMAVPVVTLKGKGSS